MLDWLTYYIRRYFGFSRGETYGIFILLLCTLLFLTIPLAYRLSHPPGAPITDKRDLALLTAWSEVLERAKRR